MAKNVIFLGGVKPTLRGAPQVVHGGKGMGCKCRSVQRC